MIPPVVVLVAYLGAARKIARETVADLALSLGCALIQLGWRVAPKPPPSAAAVAATSAPAPAAAAKVRALAMGDDPAHPRARRSQLAREALLDCARRDPETAEGLLVHADLLDGYTSAQLLGLADALDRCAEQMGGAS